MGYGAWSSPWLSLKQTILPWRLGHAPRRTKRPAKQKRCKVLLAAPLALRRWCSSVAPRTWTLERRPHGHQQGLQGVSLWSTWLERRPWRRGRWRLPRSWPPARCRRRRLGRLQLAARAHSKCRSRFCALTKTWAGGASDCAPRASGLQRNVVLCQGSPAGLRVRQRLQSCWGW